MRTRDVMTTDVVVVNPQTSVAREGRLAGIVTRRDLLRSISRADWIIEAEIRHRLGIIGDSHR